MVDTYRALEKDIWAVAAKVLSDEQEIDLRDLIEDWRSKNLDQLWFHLVRFANFGDARYESSLSNVDRPGGLFKTVKRATNAVEEADLIVERVMWLVVRMQLIMNFQVERAFLGVVTSPEVTSILSDANRLTQIGEDVSRTFAQLPAEFTKERTAALSQFMQELGEERRAAINHAMDRLTTEREAAVTQVIDRFMEQLSAERKNLLQDLKVEGDALIPVLAELRETLKIGTEAAAEINTVVGSVNDLVGRTDTAPTDPEAKPFNIDDYRATAAEVSNAAQRLNALSISLDRLLGAPWWNERVPQLVEAVMEVEDYSFVRAVLLIVIFLVGLLITLLVYRYLTARFTTPIERYDS